MFVFRNTFNEHIIQLNLEMAKHTHIYISIDQMHQTSFKNRIIILKRMNHKLLETVVVKFRAIH